MSKKTKATVVAPNGDRQEMESDMIICFGISNAKEAILDRKKTVEIINIGMGRNIPDLLFSSVIARMIGNFIFAARESEPLKAAEFMREVGRRLNKRGMELYLETELGESADEIMKKAKAEAATKEASTEAAVELIADNSEMAKMFLGILRPGLFKD